MFFSSFRSASIEAAGSIQIPPEVSIVWIFLKMQQKSSLFFFFASVKQLALSVGSVALFNDEALGVIFYRWT